MKIKIPAFTRATQWWEPKISIFTFVGLLALDAGNGSIFPNALLNWLVCLAAIALGAVYVSVINDYTDRKEDQESGKSNTLKSWSEVKSKLLVAACLLAGSLFSWYLWPDYLSLIAYLGAWISFSLYSFPPFRFKTRGILGVFSDASGAHLFPTLFIWLAMNYQISKQPEIVLTALLGIWALCYGLRGILWHQCMDVANDDKIGISTFVTRVRPIWVKQNEKKLFLVEITAFILFISLQKEWAILAALPIYFLYLWVLKKGLGIKAVIIVMPEAGESMVLMNYFYQTICVITLMIKISLVWFPMLLGIPLFFLVFPRGTKRQLTNLRRLWESRFPKNTR